MGTELAVETKPPDAETKTEGGQEKEIPKLDPNMKIQTDQGDVILGEAIKSHFAAQSAPAIQQFSPEQLARYELVEKALAGDAEAGRALWDQTLPKKEEAPVDPNSEQGQITSLQDQVKELSLAAEQTGKVSKEIVDAANANAAAQLISGAKKDFPWLAHDPVGSQKLVKRIEEINSIAQDRKVDPSTPEMIKKIRTAAFESLNSEIEQNLKHFGVTAENLSALTEQVQGNNRQPVNPTAEGIVDDQNKGGRVVIDENGVLNEDFGDGRRFGSEADERTDIPAIRSRFALTNRGQLVERSTEQLMANAQSLQTGQTRPIRAEDLKGTAAGRQDFVDQGRMSVREMGEQLKARQEEIGS